MKIVKKNNLTKNIGNLDEYNLTSRDGYIFDFNSDKWKISRINTISLEWIKFVFDENLQLIYKKTLSLYVQNNSGQYATILNYNMRGFISFASETIKAPLSLIKSSHLINYRESLITSRKYWIGQISPFLKRWVDLGYEGIEESVCEILNEWRIKGAEKGRAVQVLCPYKGPLSDLEYEAIHNRLTKYFEEDKIDLEELVLANLFLATGRRPLQICHLKIKDFIGHFVSNGQKFYLLKIPKVKQRTVWRNDFSDFALSPELGMLVETYINQIKERLVKIADLDEHSIEECPIFPAWKNLKLISKKFGDSQLQKDLRTSDLHITSNHIGNKIKKTIDCLKIISERTGEILNIFPLRFRRTLASRAAREGYGILVIAKLLDHADTQNAGVYTENTPEYLTNIDKAMALQLAPIAQAFAGTLVDYESLAKRGHELPSRIRSINTGDGVGTCGSHSFCTAYSPIACYTCHHFQPWLDGPHEIILDELIKKREEIITKTQDKTIAAVNDRTIFAVSKVLNLCDERKAELKCKSKEVNNE